MCQDRYTRLLYPLKVLTHQKPPGRFCMLFFDVLLLTDDTSVVNGKTSKKHAKTTRRFLVCLGLNTWQLIPCITDIYAIMCINAYIVMVTAQNTGKGVLTPTLQPVCNWFATRHKLKSRSGCKGRGKVFLKSPTSHRLKSVASCLLNMHKRLKPCLHRLCNLFAICSRLISLQLTGDR